MYEIIIRKKVENPDYEAQLAKWEDENKYHNNFDRIGAPSKKVTENVLCTFLTEEQYLAVQKAVLETFK